MFKKCAEPYCQQPVTSTGPDRRTKYKKFYKNKKKAKGIQTIACSLKWSKYCYYHHKMRMLDSQAVEIAKQQRDKRTLDGADFRRFDYAINFSA